MRSVPLRARGPTSPNVYELTLRESSFHGVQAIRLNPVDGSKMYGRDGILAHPFMLGPNGQSNGCVSLKDYPAFLNAYLRGEITRLVVVERLDDPPSARTAADWLSRFSNTLKEIFGRSNPLEYAYCCACATLCIEMAQERLFDLLPGRTDMLMDWAFLWSFPKGAPDGLNRPRGFLTSSHRPRFGPSNAASKRAERLSATSRIGPAVRINSPHPKDCRMSVPHRMTLVRDMVGSGFRCADGHILFCERPCFPSGPVFRR